MPLKNDWEQGDQFTHEDANDVADQVNQNTADIAARVPVTRKVNGHELSSDVTVTKSDVGLGNVTNNAQYYPGGTDVALGDGGTGASLSDPNADRILFWDDSAGAVTWLTPNTGLAISGTNLNVNNVPMSALGTGKVTGSSNGTPTTLEVWKGTQAQYDAIGSKDSNTVYVVTES